MAVLLIAIGAEAVGHNPEPFTKALIIVTLALAWLFSNTVYALHYAHLVYTKPTTAARASSSRARAARLLGLHLFRLHLRHGVRHVRRADHQPHIRKVVTIHSLAAFAFNIGVLAFTINVLGIWLGGDFDFRRCGRLPARGDKAAADDQRSARQRVSRHSSRKTIQPSADAHRKALYSVTAR